MPAELFGSAAWTNDPVRGDVLEFDGSSYAAAGELPAFPADTDFTWAFWANSTQGPNNNIIIGNRFPDEGWIKFTTNGFEFRDLPGSYNGFIDYPNFATDTWVHHAVVKQGPAFTYYRNGLALLSSSVPVDAPSVPLYFGGDQFQENWAGRLDDVATWSAALPLSSLAALATSTATPATAPLTPAPTPATLEVLADSFATTLAAWTPATRGLESTAPSTYDEPALANGTLVLGGTTAAQYWLGSSVVSNQAFDSRLYTEIDVTRVSLEGAGTAYRSSLWVFGDDTHYLHFSQNVGENGWQFNANDGTGQGTSQPTGTGNNIPSLDDLDTDTGSRLMSIRLIPLPGTSGQVNMQMLLDGQVVATHGFSQFPTSFKVMLTGQARATGDSVTAVFDDLKVRRENVANLPPSFSPSLTTTPGIAEGASLTFNAAALASDTENNPLSFRKTSGPEWISVSPAGLVTGTAPAGSAGLIEIGVQALDTVGLGTANLSLRSRIMPASLPAATLLGWWPLNDGANAVARDASGQGADGFIQNHETGGLGENGQAWATDPTHGTVLSFNGEDNTAPEPGAYVVIGDPAGAFTLPAFSPEDSFTWSLWVRPDQGANNDIILGNRYDANGVDFIPRDFVKFTSSAFEWHFNGTGENVDYPDLPAGQWMHLLVIKEGTNLFYYRDGRLVDGRPITGAPTAALPVYFAGQGVENWRGYMADVRLFTGSLSEQSVGTLFTDGPGGPPPAADDFLISSVTRLADGSITLAWPSEPGQQFSVVWSPSLNLGSWSPVGPTITATGTTTSFTLNAGDTPDPATRKSTFLRVRRL